MAVMFSSVRDGYYAQIRAQRRSSLPQHRPLITQGSTEVCNSSSENEAWGKILLNPKSTGKQVHLFCIHNGLYSFVWTINEINLNEQIFWWDLENVVVFVFGIVFWTSHISNKFCLGLSLFLLFLFYLFNLSLGLFIFKMSANRPRSQTDSVLNRTGSIDLLESENFPQK